MMSEYEASIGMECHAELLTHSKMFCSCANEFGGEPNTRCCPVCLGMPGSLPVPNEAAVQHAIRAAMALNCDIAGAIRFVRKSYTYPDLPKGYQISQYEDPIGTDGFLDVTAAGDTVRVRIRRVHIEEDTGKLLHTAGPDSLVDLNRSGVPLIEIVTEFPPDIHTAAHARAFVAQLRAVLTYLGVCDGKMEQGSLRCEPNVSVRRQGAPDLGVKTEIKNLNSFRAVERGIEHEVQRQIALIESGQPVRQETRGWSEERQETFLQRVKEEEQEYRYFPEPDLPEMDIPAEWISALRKSMPDMPEERRRRFETDLGLSTYDAGLLTDSRALADYFEATVRASGDAKAAANWIMGDLTRLLNASGLGIETSPITSQRLAELIQLISSGTISGKIAKTVLEQMFQTGQPASAIVEAEGLSAIKDRTAIRDLARAVFEENPGVVADIKERGQTQKRAFLIGQVMRASRGKADPGAVNQIVDELLV